MLLQDVLEARPGHRLVASIHEDFGHRHGTTNGEPGSHCAGSDLLGELPADFDLDVLWYPQLLPDVPARVLYYPGHTVVVAKGTDADKVKAAKDFAAFITSREEQAAMPGLDVGLLPARVDIDPKSLEVIGPVMSTMYEQLAKFGTDDFYDVRASEQLSVSLMYGLVQEVMTGTKTPADAAKAMEDKVTQLRKGE